MTICNNNDNNENDDNDNNLYTYSGYISAILAEPIQPKISQYPPNFVVDISS